MAEIMLKPAQPGFKVDNGIVTMGGPDGLKINTRKSPLNIEPQADGHVKLETASNMYLTTKDQEHQARWKKHGLGALKFAGVSAAAVGLLVAGQALTLSALTAGAYMGLFSIGTASVATAVTVWGLAEIVAIRALFKKAYGKKN